ncbi:MAG: precorrin-2 C(20)-methyltransferase [Pseudomonadota bacterium]
MTAGTFYGIGVGPGDPELLTLKAVRTIESADLVVYPATFAKESTARAIASAHIREGQREMAIGLPMSLGERDSTEAIYGEAAKAISVELSAGANVVFLCLGDPLLYGSFIYLYDLLKGEHHCAVVPGITSVSASSAASLAPLTRLNQSLLVMPAFTTDAALDEALATHDSVVIMKVGRQRHRIAERIAISGRVHDAVYVEHATMEDQTIIHNIAELPEGPGSYFSLFMVTRQS